ncbi:hypothetical protein RGU70_02685 [Herbaspirillum sp. RTI4]|uniref:hypothetical protein n=1 Tax=Herbaspirillum sp. RTI4 TaxID=3048640 RepID=UPI002AB4D295|nr:hypothetical protein [Herbaspirillum sp. RTI4]MDY7577235.1 hypothetical protein [Herbaspirillum sp. RTI4]MEA9980525.1 hypothetical protein [Herbaspirillum sp. RTI4]
MSTLTASYSSHTSLVSKIRTVLHTLSIAIAANKKQRLLNAQNLHADRELAYLNSMSNSMEATQPNLAAELRFIASRG